MSLRRVLSLMFLLGMSLTARGDISCSITASALSFGTYNHMDLLPLDSSASLTVECGQTGLSLVPADLPLPYTLSLSTGTAGSYSPREMNGGGSTLDYNLHPTAARLSIWGDGTGGTVTKAGTILVPGCLILLCSTQSQVETVYGRIPASQIVPAGAYGDLIEVTLTY